MQKFAIKRGLRQVKSGDLKKVKDELMFVLGINTRAGFRLRVTGQVEPKVSEAQAIEAVFAKYGVKQVWGE